MEFGSSSNSYSNRERLICEEDEMIGIDYEMGNIISNTGSNQAVKLHFSTTYASNSSSSPSSASSHHHHHYTTQTQQLLPLTTHHQNYNKQQQPQMGSWLLGKTTTTTTTAAELEDVSNEEEAAAPRKEQAIIMQETKDIIEEGEAEEDRVLISLEKEHMFDKVVTPSDVGKLNRLVIPKQHAEKYFPLDSSSNEKGLLLNFEDRNGKPWRFRYSYWNSSQSYVMTKGWSRFVKDKKLDAGDVVSFHRGVGDLAKGRLFIDWRRRSHPPAAAAAAAAASFSRHLPFHRSIPWNPLLMTRPPVLPASMYSQSQINNNFYNRNSISLGGTGNNNNVLSPHTLGSILYLRSQLPAAPATQQPPPPPPHTEIGMTKWQQHPIVFDSVPVVQGKATAKRLRLFGVNMDCPITESDDECHILSSSTSIQHATMVHDQPSQLSSSSQLSLYDATPLLPPFDFLNKGKASMSFD